MHKETSPHTLSPLSAAYWHSANAQLRQVRTLALGGLAAAMAVVLELFPIYLMGPTLKIYFSFIAVSVGAYVYGPITAMMVGGIIDVVGFLLAAYGEPYFPGFLLSAILSGLVYGLFLYRQRLSVLRLVLLRLVINFGVNVALGSLWKAMLYGKGYLYYLTSGLVKNTLLLPVEVLLTLMVLRLMLPVLGRSGLVPRPVQTDIRWL
ncbi:MAG: folate family ECF transporter S component [Oscillospiraceae bacterium]|nr:folate family ECF transporter S component [Oscillospiraceae bacterium]